VPPQQSPTKQSKIIMKESPVIITESAKDLKTINKKFNPTKIFVDRNRLALFWFLIAMVAVFVAIVQPIILVERFKERERVVILDPAGTYYVSPILDFEEASDLHVAQGTLAAKALLQSNPAGFDDEEVLKRIFLPSAVKKAKQFWQGHQEEFESKEIHQKVEIAQLNILETRGDFTLIEVKGQLIRTGAFQEKMFVESMQFRLALKMTRNPDMTINNRFPTAVTDFKYETIQP